MITDELLEQLHKLDRVNKLRVIQLLLDDLAAEEWQPRSSGKLHEAETLLWLRSALPEEVFAMFLTDLQNPISVLESFGDILEEECPSLSEDLLRALKSSLKNIRNGLNFGRNYLETRKK